MNNIGSVKHYILMIITLTTPTVIIQVQLKMENKQTYNSLHFSKYLGYIAKRKRLQKTNCCLHTRLFCTIFNLLYLKRYKKRV